MPQTTPETGSEDDLKKKLVRRVAFAAVLIGVLLGALAFVDYLGQPGNDPVVSGPVFNEPVPIAKKEVSLPVTAAEPANAAAPIDTPGVTPATEEATVAANVVSAPAADVPGPPQVAAQPALPKTPSRSTSSAARPAPQAANTTPAEGTSSALVPRESVAEKTGASPVVAAPPATALEPARVAPPAPPRLFSGYAVQVGVFADAKHAEDLRAKLAESGIPTVLEARVQVGPFKTREEAEAARKKLKSLGVEGILLPPKSAKR